jgi:molybdopterin synthase catalytic subunit
MTEREITRHVEEAKARWPLLDVTIIHRIGQLAAGDNVVLVAVASAHRRAAFEAAQFLMDYLKTRAPFWKCEERAGESQWLEARSSDETAVRRWRQG